MKIAGISSKKLPDPNEGGIDNKNLYNDKELFDEADLDWYDYGFRNYDPQIGRFVQLDPLTDDYPELTPYQYASNDPIANIDLDGLEGFNSLQTLETVVIKSVKKTAPAAVKTVTLSALNVGINAYKIGKAVTDHTQVVKTGRNVKVPLNREPSLLTKINDWFKSLNGGGTVPVGSGSHQKAGAIVDGGEGDVDSYRDKADIITDHYHMGSFMELLSLYKPSGVEGSITNPTVENTVTSVDAVSKAGEQTYKTVHEENPKWSKPKQTFVNQTGIFVDDSSVNADGSKTYFQRIQKLKHPIKVPTTYRTK